MIKDIVFYSVDFKPNKCSDFIDVHICNRLKDAVAFVKVCNKDEIEWRMNRHYREFDLSTKGNDTSIKSSGGWRMN